MTQCNFKTHLWEFICTLKGKSWWSLKNNPEGIPIKWMNLKFWSWGPKFWTLGIESFLQFLSLKWWNGLQNRNVLEKLSKIGPSQKFWHLVNICTKVNFFGNWTFAQFLSFELGMAIGRGGAEGWDLRPRLAWIFLTPSPPRPAWWGKFLAPSPPLKALRRPAKPHPTP